MHDRRTILIFGACASLCTCLAISGILYVTMRRTSSGAASSAAVAAATVQISAAAQPQQRSQPQQRQSQQSLAQLAEGVVTGGRAVRAGAAPQTRACPAWATRHEVPETQQMLDRAKQGPSTLAFVGDSITGQLNHYNVPQTYAAALGKATVAIHGVAADTTGNALWRLCASFPTASVYVVHIGTNDFGLLAATPQQVSTRVQELVSYIRARNPGAHIIVLGIFWRAPPHTDAVSAANALIVQWIKGGDARLHYADWGTKLGPGDMPDGLHPSQAGWDKVLRRVIPYARALAGV